MKTGYTHITLVLDRSGSMESIRTDAIGGCNRFLADQQALPGEATLSLVQFNQEPLFLHEFAPLAGIPPLNDRTFVPEGNTALLDALGEAIQRTGKRLAALIEAERPAKVLVVVLTDGAENASRHFTREKIAALIRHQETRYGWGFLFLAANQDAILTAAGMGLAADQAANFCTTGPGSREAMRVMSSTVSRVRTGQTPRMSLNPEDRDSLRRPKHS